MMLSFGATPAACAVRLQHYQAERGPEKFRKTDSAMNLAFAPP